MDNPNFEKEFVEKITKIRSLLENLPRIDTNSQALKPQVGSTESSLTVNKVTPKDDYGRLLQTEYISASQQDLLMSEPQSVGSADGMTKKKKKKKKRTVDPLRPTKKRSFGVDIGQGINTIKYIKENCCPNTEARTNRLMNIFLRPLPVLKTEKSLENIYRLKPLSQDSSRTNIHSRSEQMKKAGEQAARELSSLFAESEEDMYRIRYKDYANELAKDYGIDDLQALFVPYHHRGDN